ncbi:glycosyltransferase family A protein [Nocardioides sp. 616]|uniref:glycosyltransferase family A protein n=1 Tax=Nocardioides sp. 616 TaxID=2268090 RepID=UPI000CE35BA9|nr:glycosyltransferase family A protein [Nocardioides sp. 616]
MNPFLTFLVPVGSDPDQLRETLLSLAAQTSTSFEALLVRTRDEGSPTGLSTGMSSVALDDLLAGQPGTLRSRLRTLEVDAAGPLGWLEPALAQAQGDYVTVSDGLTWFAHWVQSCQQHAGDGLRTLRGLVLHQEVTSAAVGGLAGVRATGAPARRGSGVFSVLEHLGPDPTASRHGFAFPRAALASADPLVEAPLGTAALRDLVLRTVARTGITEVGEVIAIRSAQGPEEDPADLERLLAVVDGRGWQLPPGSLSALVAGVGSMTDPSEDLRHQLRLKDDHIVNIEAQVARLEQRVARLEATLTKRDAQVARLRAKVAGPAGKAGDQGAEEPGTEATSRWGRRLGRTSGRD